MKYWRDETQGTDINNWGNPRIQMVDFSNVDKHQIGTISRPDAGTGYDWCRDPATNEIVLGTPFSIWKMLADPRVRENMLRENGRTYDVNSIHLECMDPGRSYDHARHKALRELGQYPDNMPWLPVWQWILVRKGGRKRF